MMKDYSQISKQKEKTEKTEEVLRKEPPKEEPPKEEPPKEEPPKEKVILGVVTNCNKLNVRKAPSKLADILCVIDRGTVVTIDQTPSDPAYDDNIYDGWTHVRINDVVGYVMGEYLKEV